MDITTIGAAVARCFALSPATSILTAHGADIAAHHEAGVPIPQRLGSAIAARVFQRLTEFDGRAPDPNELFNAELADEATADLLELLPPGSQLNRNAVHAIINPAFLIATLALNRAWTVLQRNPESLSSLASALAACPHGKGVVVDEDSLAALLEGSANAYRQGRAMLPDGTAMAG